jgi:hypothetical protein
MSNALLIVWFRTGRRCREACVDLISTPKLRDKGDAHMSFQVDRSPFDPESGFEYYICFKPKTEVEGDEVESRISIEVALSISETGDIADLSFLLPKICRNDYALSFLKRDPNANCVENRVFIALARLERRRCFRRTRNPRAGPFRTYRRHRNQRLHSQDEYFHSRSCVGRKHRCSPKRRSALLAKYPSGIR